MIQDIPEFQGDMAIPILPGADLVLVGTHLTFALLEILLIYLTRQLVPTV
jgi:hypothetical protein